MKITNGFVLWQGDSLLDGKHIAVIVTGLTNPSYNRKTGDQLQSFILKTDVAPTAAIAQGIDESICGQCPLKKSSCYVNPMGINNVWRKYTRGEYPLVNEQILSFIKLWRRSLRLGSYGDPAAAPLQAWLPLLEVCSSATGYTHQWRECDRSWQQYLMASVEKESDVALANFQGWRTFRIKLPEQPLLASEIICTNTVKPIKCEDCLMCDGNRHHKQVNVCTDVHGLSWKQKNFRELLVR